jgi:hypothetical protein
MGSRKKRYYQFTAIDDCTRLRILKIYEHCNQKTAIQFADHVLEKLPFEVQTIQTDNGSEFQSGFHWPVRASRYSVSGWTPRRPAAWGIVSRSDSTACSGVMCLAMMAPWPVPGEGKPTGRLWLRALSHLPAPT